ncbi:MAG: GH1 family beta-glucosidase [Bacillota bacterium]|nr:GH1 family beta-glucosidase [Bacillota bacterium]
MLFPKEFVFGAAAASYQIEGAAYEDQKGLSVWDMFCKRQGAVKGNHTGDVACDHYGRFAEDCLMMREMGLEAYRFSISWPRVLPDGTGTINNKGLDFYDRLVDELLKYNIKPYATLFHWDYPYELHKKGGWLNPESPDWFSEYTKVVVERLSDRVKDWFTLNEPMTFVNLGYELGMHAPGLELDTYERLAITHNTLLAHGKSVETIRSYSKQPANIGFAMGTTIKYPSSGAAEDINAAREYMFDMKCNGIWANTWWMDPILLGSYPEDGIELLGKYMPKIKQEDMKIISKPLDFLGLNIYNGGEVGRDKNGCNVEIPPRCGFPQTANTWTVTPEVIYWGPRFCYERYKIPIIVAENGMAGLDWICLDNKVHDYQRIDFINRYIKELKRAINDGVDVKGYFHWSLMDNFEWSEGYNHRFGLVHVDYATQKRTIKDSGIWYKKVIESRGDAVE